MQWNFKSQALLQLPIMKSMAHYHRDFLLTHLWGSLRAPLDSGTFEINALLTMDGSSTLELNSIQIY